MEEYFKVGTTLNDTFDYPSSVTYGSYVTGLTQAAFTVTLAKNGVAGASTTGITITALQAATGTYAIQVSGATGFVAATGTYELRIQRTANPADCWAFTYRVTSDGTGAGSWGDASFTATAANGRITDGISALAGATVRILDSTGALYVQTTSTAAGLYGPIFFNANGTYTVSAQKAGYTVATGTIVVVGSTATGPGADIALTATGNGTGLTASGLWAFFKRCLRDRSGVQADLLAQQGVDDALAMIATERDWAWYETVANVTLNALSNTGTVTATNGSAVVTLAGGTFPTWAASADIYIGGRIYGVLSRDSGTQVTLDSAFGEATIAGASYTIAQTSYALPSDLMALSRIVFEPTWPYGTQPASMQSLVQARQLWQGGESRPGAWAMARDRLVVFPFPSASRTITLSYYRRPALLASGADEADWDPLQLPLLRAAIAYQAALRGECVYGSADDCMKNYRAALDRASTFGRTSVASTVNYEDDQRFDGNARTWGVTGP